MLVLEYKAITSQQQAAAIDEAIRTGQFIQNKCLRAWMDRVHSSKYDLNRYCKQLAAEFDFAAKLNSMARQAHAERAWSAVSRFYDNCKKGMRPVGFPKFKKFSRSVEYKTSGWKVTGYKRISFTDKNGIGELRLLGEHPINPDDEWLQSGLIKRVRIVRRADGYYVQLCIKLDRREEIAPSFRAIGLDVGLESFYTDSDGNKEPNPQFLRRAEQRIKKLQRQLSKKQKGSSNRAKARKRLAKAHLKISRQRKEHAKRVARCVVTSNDVVAYEDLRIKNMVKNHCLAKSISDAAWYEFRRWIEYYGEVYGKSTIAVPPQFTSQECSSCGAIVKKSLSTRTHVCRCGCRLDRDHNAAINILASALSTVGHTGTSILEMVNAAGVQTAFHSDLRVCLGKSER